MILAHYTIRSKQSYIFQSNKMLEITGGSAIIANAFEFLYQEARKCGLRVQSVKDMGKDLEFHLEEVRKGFQEKTIHMVELFAGGGNDTVLYADAESFQKANRAFTYYLLKHYPGLVPLCVGIPIEGRQDQYKKDYAALMEAVDSEKNKMLPGSIMPAMPFSEMDRNTWQPIAYKDRAKQISRSWQSQVKYVAGSEKNKDLKKQASSVEFLDDIVTEKGQESLLAIVHADGNNMGVKIQHLMDGHEDYDVCVPAMRRFTSEIQDAFVDAGLQGIRAALEELRKEDHAENYRRYQYRLLIADGDDFTFICNARFALTLTKAYLKAVSDYRSENDPEQRYSSCAGICIFHSHYPFARAYELAEQACDSAKRPVHKTLGQKDEKGKPAPAEECWLDFHYLHSGVGGDLKELRRRQATAGRMARPWRVSGGGTHTGGEAFGLEKMEITAEKWKENGGGRSNIKKIGAAFEIGREDGIYELSRVYYRNEEMKRILMDVFHGDQERLYKALYDVSEMYDIWFGGREVS